MHQWIVALVFLLSLGLAFATGFSPDNRQIPPWTPSNRCVGKVLRPAAWGSGVLIGPDLFLTCGHVVVDPLTDKVVPDLRVQMGYADHLKLEAEITEVFWPKPTDFSAGSGLDYAIVRLSRPLGLYYGWLPCKNLSNQELRHQKIDFVGYGTNQYENRSEFFGGKNPWVSSGEIMEAQTQVFGHNCSGWAGSSGGPLLSKTEPVSVLGIFAASFGNSQDGGFLDGYKPHEAGNVGVPARRWAETLNKIPAKQYTALRCIDVRNATLTATAVRLRFRSVWGDGEITSASFTIPPRSKLEVLTKEDGFNGPELWMKTQTLSQWSSSKNTGKPVDDRWGEFHRHNLGPSGDSVLYIR